MPEVEYGPPHPVPITVVSRLLAVSSLPQGTGQLSYITQQLAARGTNLVNIVTISCAPAILSWTPHSTDNPHLLRSHHQPVLILSGTCCNRHVKSLLSLVRRLSYRHSHPYHPASPSWGVRCCQKPLTSSLSPFPGLGRRGSSEPRFVKAHALSISS